jgi:hypothetical protein
MEQADKVSKPMETFVVDRTVPGLTTQGLVEVQRLLREAARRVSETGERVRYLRCTLIPEQDRCLCVFEAESLSSVRRVNEIAQVPFGRIGRAAEFVQEDADDPAPAGERGE